jgi:hypothetical protein
MGHSRQDERSIYPRRLSTGRQRRSVPGILFKPARSAEVALIGQAERTGVSSSMLKFISPALASLFCAFTLHAQSEPEKKATTGKSSPPPTVKDASRPPADKPAPVSTPAPGQDATTTAAAKPKIDKDPPAVRHQPHGLPR